MYFLYQSIAGHEVVLRVAVRCVFTEDWPSKSGTFPFLATGPGHWSIIGPWTRCAISYISNRGSHYRLLNQSFRNIYVFKLVEPFSQSVETVINVLSGCEQKLTKEKRKPLSGDSLSPAAALFQALHLRR